MNLIRNKNIYIGKSNSSGYGVFANKKIYKNEIIQQCPFIPTIYESQLSPIKDITFDLKNIDGIKNMRLPGLSALTLGAGPMFNTSLDIDDRNVEWNVGFGRAEDRIPIEYRYIEFVSTRDIEEGEELIVYYGHEWLSHRDVNTIFNEHSKSLQKFKKEVINIIRKIIDMKQLKLNQKFYNYQKK